MPFFFSTNKESFNTLTENKKNEQNKTMDINRLFLDPHVVQEGSHMVMTGVQRPIKYQTLNIDTRFCNNVSFSATANAAQIYEVCLPEKMTNIKSMQVLGAELCHSWFNFSQLLHNVSFLVSYSASFATYTTISVPDSEYTSVTDLVDALNLAIANAVEEDSTSAAAYLSFSSASVAKNASQKYCIINAASNELNTTIYIRFVPSACGGTSTNVASGEMIRPTDTFLLKQQLGWKLGFRQVQYALSTNADSPITSESWIDLSGPRYAYIAVEPFTNHASRGLIVQYPSAIASKTILAKIPLANTSFGDNIAATPQWGLISQKVHFDIPGGIHLQKMRFQLTNEFGFPLDTHNVAFSFSLLLHQE